MTEPEDKQQPPPPRSVYPRLTVSPPPVPSLDRPASAAFLIGYSEDCPTPSFVRLGEGLTILFPIGTRILNSASCSFPVFYWFYTDNRAPFCFVSIGQELQKAATSPVSRWRSLPKPPSYDDVTLPQAGRPPSGWWSGAPAAPPQIQGRLGGRPGRRAALIHPLSRTLAPPGPSRSPLGPVARTCPRGKVPGTCWTALQCEPGTAPLLGNQPRSGSGSEP